jgi:2-polyprenyl-3-methyl-5-hydroxy-6-metoxy-1,4-benzoquinol methylase
MSELILQEPLASQVRREAEAQGVDIESYLKSALRLYRFHAQKAKLSVEVEWWRARSEEERKRFAGEFVAVHNQEVVDHDADEQALLKRIRLAFGKAPILVTPAEGQRIYRIVSTRLASS